MTIQKDTYKQLLRSYPQVPPENGGILGSRDGVICTYFHDNRSANLLQATYEPDAALLTAVLQQWTAQGIDFVGIVHSHPPHQDTLSDGDAEYLSRLLKSNPQMKAVYCPLVLPNEQRMIAFVAELINGQPVIRKDDIYII